MAEPTGESKPSQITTSGGAYVEGDVESKEFVGRDKQVQGDIIYGNKVIYQHLDPQDARSQAKEKSSNRRRGSSARLGQVSAVVLILAITTLAITTLAITTLAITTLPGNFQGISQSLSQIFPLAPTPIPTVETIVTTVPRVTKTPLPVPTHTPQPTPSTPALPTPALPITGVRWNCEGKDYNCTDFAFRNEAQEIYDFCIEAVGYDIYGLDLDHDGVACESNAEPTGYNCEENRYNCSDFVSQDEAQRTYDFCWHSTNLDVHRLDPDHDGIACER